MYFSRLELELDEEMAEEAAKLAKTADARDLAALSARLAELAAEHAKKPFTKPKLQALSAQYGSALGELVRARVGGGWGIGRLFTEELRGGLLLGERGIRFWPWNEVRDRITGRAATPLAERIARLCERANEEVDEDEDEDEDEDADEAPRLYPLKAGEGYFDAGVTRDGRQVLMAAFYPATFAIFFAADGAFLEYVERPNENGSPDDAALKRWQAELGFTPKTIRVVKFMIPQMGVGIEDLASHDEEFLEDPESEEDETEREERFKSIRKWIDGGCFVLYWGNDLWLDGTGHVTSS